MLSCSAWVRCLHAAGRVSGQMSHHSSVTATTVVGNPPGDPVPCQRLAARTSPGTEGSTRSCPHHGEPLGMCKSCGGFGTAGPRGGSLGEGPQGLVVEALEAPGVLQGGPRAHCLPAEISSQPAVGQAVQEALQGRAQGLRGRRGWGGRGSAARRAGAFALSPSWWHQGGGSTHGARPAPGGHHCGPSPSSLSQLPAVLPHWDPRTPSAYTTNRDKHPGARPREGLYLQ